MALLYALLTALVAFIINLTTFVRSPSCWRQGCLWKYDDVLPTASWRDLVGLECRKHLDTQKLGGAAVGNIHLHSLPAAFPAKLIKKRKRKNTKPSSFTQMWTGKPWDVDGLLSLSSASSAGLSDWKSGECISSPAWINYNRIHTGHRSAKQEKPLFSLSLFKWNCHLI